MPDDQKRLCLLSVPLKASGAGAMKHEQNEFGGGYL